MPVPGGAGGVKLEAELEAPLSGVLGGGGVRNHNFLVSPVSPQLGDTRPDKRILNFYKIKEP